MLRRFPQSCRTLVLSDLFDQTCDEMDGLGMPELRMRSLDPSSARKVFRCIHICDVLFESFVRIRRVDRVQVDRTDAVVWLNGAGAPALTPDGMFWQQRTRIADLAIADGVPTIGWMGDIADAGALISYGADTPDLFRKAATYIDKILKGASPADLPIEQPTKFEFIINLKTAKALGLTIPPALLIRANKLIE
jgi:hypothetical protein